MNVLNKTYRRLLLWVQCPLCGRTIRFNWWWIVDVDTYFYCRSCGIRLVQLVWLVPALMTIYAAGHLFNLYQTLSAARIDVSNRIVQKAIVYLLIIAAVRVALLFILFKLKFAKSSAGKNKQTSFPKNKDSALWWEPFANDKQKSTSN